MPEKAACSFQNKPNLPNSRTRGRLAELEKLVCESRMSEVNVSMQNQIYFTALLSLKPPNHTIPATNLQANKTDQSKDYDILYDCKQKHGLGVVQACHPMISDLPKM